jgi:hypothetical protein
MTLENFIPEIWSATLQSNLNESHIYASPEIVNRDYEGDIKQAGDRVHINSIGRVTIGNYVKNTPMGEPETLTDAQQTLVIDQQKYFHFQVDDIDKAQQNPKVMTEAMKEAAYGLARVEDLYLASLYTGADAGNLLGNDVTPVTLTTPEEAYELLVDLSVLLDEANIPQGGRTAVVPPWFEGVVRKDPRWVAGTGGQASTLSSGEISTDIAGFRVFKSNNVPNTAGDQWKIQAAHRMARSFADQVSEVSAYRPEKRFADAVTGLHVYGGKIVRPTAIAVATVNRPA